MVEYVSRKIWKKTLEEIYALQAECQLKTRERVSQAELIGKAMEFVSKNKKEFLGKFITKKEVPLEKDPAYLLMKNPVDIGKATDASKDVDKVVYGV